MSLSCGGMARPGSLISCVGMMMRGGRRQCCSCRSRDGSERASDIGRAQDCQPLSLFLFRLRATCEFLCQTRGSRLAASHWLF
jgi:hypothetical protein